MSSNPARAPSTRASVLTISASLMLSIALNGCATNEKTGAAVGAGGGAAGGAAVGAAVGAPAAGVGAAAGAAVGAVAGAIIGSAKDRTDAQREAANRAYRDKPVMASAVVENGTADINDDGFVTLDEIIAMSKAGLSDDEIILRCRRTQQIFSLSNDQQKILIENGVHPRVAMALRDLNKDLTEEPPMPPVPREPPPPGQSR